jgi:hypothetical protein
VRIVEGIGIAILILLLLLGALFLRRGFIVRRGGTIPLSIRLTTLIPGRGWAVGLARFVDDELRWYRMFSLSWRPRRVLRRGALAVEQRRLPNGPEQLVLPADWIIIRCLSKQTPVEIAMAEGTLTGFLSWMESAPPGSARPDTPPRRSRAA